MRIYNIPSLILYSYLSIYLSPLYRFIIPWYINMEAQYIHRGFVVVVIVIIIVDGNVAAAAACMLHNS